MPRGIVNRRDKFNWDNCHMPDGQSLPRVTSEDSGKILTVDENGKWSADESEVSKEITNAGIAHFADAANAPLADLKVDIKAVQAGSGDPSPTNVRPITGFSSVVVTRTGKNLFDYNAISQITIDSGTKNGMLFTKAGKYSVSCQNNGNFCYCRIFNADGTVKTTYYIVSSATKTPATFTITNGEYFVLYDGDPGHSLPTSKSIFAGWHAQVELSDAPTDYEPYNGTVYTVTMPAAEGNVYGGTLDVLTGKLTVTHVCKQITTVSTLSDGDGKGANINLSPLANSHLISQNELMCNCLKPSNYADAYDNHVHFANTSICSVRFADVIGTTKAEWETYLAANPLYICYKIETPIVYNLTPTEVYSLLGENNIFANSGDILSVSYVTREYAPLTAMIEDKTTRFFDAVEDLGTYDVSLVGATSTDVKNYLLTHPNASIVIRVKRYSTILLYYLREYSPNYFAEFATPANIFEAENTKSMRIDYLRLDLTQETSDFTNDSIIIPSK